LIRAFHLHTPRKAEPPFADYDSAVASVRRFDIPRSPVDERGQSHSLECFKRNIRIIGKDNEEDTVYAHIGSPLEKIIFACQKLTRKLEIGLQ